MLNFILKPCCRNLFNSADLFCHLPLFFNRTARLHTRQSWLKTGLLPTAVNSLVKINGLRTRLTSTLLTTISGKLCLNATIISTQPEDIDKLKKVLQMGPSATRLDQQSHTELVWKLVVDTSNIPGYAKTNYLWDIGICNNSQCFLTMKITSCCWLFHA